MIQQTFNDIYSDELAEGAIINDRHTGHKNDYLVLHCLIRKYKPKCFCELGTNTGFGTKIIKNALDEEATVFTIDLPPGQASVSKQHPISEGKGDCVGHECDGVEYVQILADTRTFDYTKFPFDGFFVDTDHTYSNVFIETRRILLCEPKIIVWHDVDENEVFNAIVDAMKGQEYDLVRVIDTRIMYATKKENNGAA